MATLKAAALILNGAIFLLGVWGFSQFGFTTEKDVLIGGLLLVGPVVNSAAVILRNRKEKGA